MHVETRLKGAAERARSKTARALKPRSVLAGLGATSALAGTFAASLRPVLAQSALDDTTGSILPLSDVGTHDVVQGALLLGAVAAALLAAFASIRTRARLSRDNAALRERLADLSAEAEQLGALIDVGDGAILVWTGNDAKPALFGALPDEFGVPANRAAILAFGRWLDAASVSTVNQAIASLRQKAESFSVPLATLNGAGLVADGRTSGARAIVRFAPMDRARREITDLNARLDLLSRLERTHTELLAAAHFPAWQRDAGGKVVWVNAACASALGHPSVAAMLAAGDDLLDANGRARVNAALATRPVFSGEVSTVIAGERRRFDVSEVAHEGGGSFGIAIDVEKLRQMQAEIESLNESHAGTLDLLATAIAVFDQRQRLVFYNQAFRQLWDLDQAYLADGPTHTLLLDRLRSEGKLAEQPNWRDFKDKILADYRAVEPSKSLWRLPDGQIVRVLANQTPDGGLTTVYENLTREYSLQSENQTLHRVQTETLDRLVEGVAVFGTDGRLSLHNAAFLHLWGLKADAVEIGDHIRDIGLHAERVEGDDPWPAFTAAITGAEDSRDDKAGQIELQGGRVLSSSLVHLPDGQSMLTFVDVTDSVRAEQFLMDRNAALEEAATIKTRFVQRVSHALRAPLTSIKGFAEVLRLPDAEPLSDSQSQYLDLIVRSSGELELMINDILDLATIDAGMMSLEPVSFDLSTCIEEALTLTGSRFASAGIEVKTSVEANLGEIEGEPRRIRQILFNVLDNAANHAPDGSTVSVNAKRKGGEVTITIADQGPGLPEALREQAFDRFVAEINKGRRRGVGLGLSIAESFVRLHHGTIRIDSTPGLGATVTITLPVRQPAVGAQVA